MIMYFSLPRDLMKNADLTRIINSDEIQRVVRPAKYVAYNLYFIIISCFIGDIQRVVRPAKYILS